MGHKKPETPVQSDNSIVENIFNSRFKKKRNKAMYMRFYWSQDRIKQAHLNIFLKPGVTNLGDYFMKRHPLHYHRQMQPVYLYQAAHMEHASARVRYSVLGRDGKSRPNTRGKTKARLLGQSNTGLDTGFRKQLSSLRAVPKQTWFKLP